MTKASLEILMEEANEEVSHRLTTVTRLNDQLQALPWWAMVRRHRVRTEWFEAFKLFDDAVITQNNVFYQLTGEHLDRIPDANSTLHDM